MKPFFFLTTSLNFGNIFSSESISPEVFYRQRGFGFDYFSNIFLQVKDFTVLFEQFPSFELPKSNETDSYKIVFEFELQTENLVATDEKEIWLCPYTIYLNFKNLKKVHFFSKDEQMRVVAKAESSKSLKTMSKYQGLFDHISHQKINQIVYNYDFHVNEVNQKIELQINRDRLFNNFKGFIYCFLCGEVSKKSPNEIAFLKSLQKIKNNFALLKNSLAHTTFKYFQETRKTYSYDIGNSESANDIIKNLKDSISESEGLFKNSIANFEEVDYKTNYIKDVVFKGQIDEHGLVCVKRFAEFMRGVDNNLEREARNWFWENNPENPFILYLTIKYATQCYRETKNKEKQEQYDSEILKSVFKIEKYAEKRFLENAKNIQPVNLDIFELDNGQNNISISERSLDKHFENIANIILQNCKKIKGKVSDNQLLSIVEKTGDLFGEGKGKGSNLYKYLTKQENIFTEKSETTPLFKNFTAFIFNANEIEKLQKYMEEKKINEPHYAFSFYGIFNGFASLSKDFTKAIIENKQLQNDIDVYLAKVIQKINKSEIFFRSQEIPKLENENFPSYETIVEEGKNLAILNKQSAEEISKTDDLQKLDLQELKERVLYKAKFEKIQVNEDIINAIDKSLSEIERILFKVPLNGQKFFVKRQLKYLLIGKFKVAKFGETRVTKLCNLID